jgi:hypothetical protein
MHRTGFYPYNADYRQRAIDAFGSYIRWGYGSVSSYGPRIPLGRLSGEVFSVFCLECLKVGGFFLFTAGRHEFAIHLAAAGPGRWAASSAYIVAANFSLPVLTTTTTMSSVASVTSTTAPLAGSTTTAPVTTAPVSVSISVQINATTVLVVIRFSGPVSQEQISVIVQVRPKLRKLGLTFTCRAWLR